MCELLHKIAALGLQGTITLVLDNARYQHCALVKDLAATLNIQLQFLPSYSANLKPVVFPGRRCDSEAVQSRARSVAGHIACEYAAGS